MPAPSVPGNPLHGLLYVHGEALAALRPNPSTFGFGGASFNVKCGLSPLLLLRLKKDDEKVHLVSPRLNLLPHSSSESGEAAVCNGDRGNYARHFLASRSGRSGRVPAVIAPVRVAPGPTDAQEHALAALVPLAAKKHQPKTPGRKKAVRDECV